MPDNPSVYYNIACIYANQNKPEESVVWLKKAVEKGFNDWEHIKTDSDLDNIRSSSYYKEFIKEHSFWFIHEAFASAIRSRNQSPLLSSRIFQKSAFGD